MTPTQVAHIMALVDEYAQSLKWGDYPLSKAAKRRAIEAALRDAPQQAEGWVMVPVAPTQTMMQQGKHALYEESMGDFDASLLEIKATYRAMLAARPSAPTAVEPDERADMFWDHGDPERFGHDIDEIVQDYGPGEIVKIDQAKRLPTITVRVLPPKDEDSNLEYEVIDDHTASASKGTPL